MQIRFIVGKITEGPVFKFGDCEVYVQENGDIKVAMKAYWKRITPICMTRTRRKLQKALMRMIHCNIEVLLELYCFLEIAFYPKHH